MAITTETATMFAAIPRARHGGPNFMDGAIVTTKTVTTSSVYYMFHLPPDCTVIRGHIKGSFPASGVSGQAILKLGTDTLDSKFATFTISGGAANPGFQFYGPFTCTSSGTNGATPVLINVTSSATATTSLSIYVLIEYVLPGNSGTL